MISPLRTLIIVIILVMTPVDPQMAMYGMPPPPPVHVGAPMPMPMPVPVPVPFAVILSDTKSTTSTTTQRTILGLPIPVPIPVPMQVPMQLPYSFPAFPSAGCQKARPPGCPPCPPCLCFPSCTPAFFSFCSPCHQQCRCRSKEETPEPVPMAPLAPPPMGPPPYGVAYGAPMERPMVLMIPFPPPIVIPKPDKKCGSSSGEGHSSESDCEIETNSDDSLSIESSSSEKKRKKQKKKKKKKKEKKKKKNWKKHLKLTNSRKHSNKDYIDVQPVISFVSRNGDVKIRRRLSNAQAVQLLRRRRDSFDNRLSKRNTTYNGRRSKVQHRRRQVIVPRRLAQGLMTNDMKSVVFKPPPGATISNLSMSFQISM